MESSAKLQIPTQNLHQPASIRRGIAVGTLLAFMASVAPGYSTDTLDSSVESSPPESSVELLRQAPRFYTATSQNPPPKNLPPSQAQNPTFYNQAHSPTHKIHEVRDEFEDITPNLPMSNNPAANPLFPREPLPTYYKPDSRSTYLNTTIGLLGGGIIVSIIGLYIMPESVTNWDRSRFGFSAWLQDVQIGPVIDSDNFILNGVAHPYFGAVYYMQPRVAGYSWAESAFFAFVTSSIFWEYGIEAFVEIPSWQDLIYTPAMGSIFGELFYQSTKYIQSHDNNLFGSRALGLIVVGLMDPIGVIMRDFGLARAMGVNDMSQVISYATPFKVGFAMRF